MYVVFIKENGNYSVRGIAETMDEVITIINKNNLKDKINEGKAYLIEGNIKLIRPETTPALLDIKEVTTKKNSYY